MNGLEVGNDVDIIRETGFTVHDRGHGAGDEIRHEQPVKRVGRVLQQLIRVHVTAFAQLLA